LIFDSDFFKSDAIENSCYPSEFAPKTSKNNRTQAEFEKPYPEKEKCPDRKKEKKLCGLNSEKFQTFVWQPIKVLSLEPRFLTWNFFIP
jgi:hypothetical protein